MPFLRWGGLGKKSVGGDKTRVQFGTWKDKILVKYSVGSWIQMCEVCEVWDESFKARDTTFWNHQHVRGFKTMGMNKIT